METSASYLHTLSHDEAIALVASLQKVSDHLSRELEWMNQQIQQKTVQLQGIQTLLAETAVLGLNTPETNSTGDEAITQEAITAAITELGALPSQSPKVEQTQENSPVSNGNLPPDSRLNNSKNGGRKSPATSNTRPKGKSGTTGKATAASTKKPSRSTKSSSPGSKSTKKPELRDLLLPKFKGNTLTDAVAKVLASAKQPLHLNDILAEMYGILPAPTSDKAKISLANVLSIGKKEGKWQNLGDGMYTAKATS